METKKEKLQPFADNHRVVGPQYYLRNRSKQRQQRRILNGFNFRGLIEQSVPFSLGDGGPQYVVNRPIPTQVERSSPTRNPKTNDYKGNYQEKEKIGLPTNL